MDGVVGLDFYSSNDTKFPRLEMFYFILQEPDKTRLTLFVLLLWSQDQDQDDTLRSWVIGIDPLILRNVKFVSNPFEVWSVFDSFEGRLYI